ncbi:MAG: hypothetical protein PHP93_08170 [Kiritimatiellales bacterium]|nr:hypothetical protein [Kiritimatiellales bacterium]
MKRWPTGWHNTLLVGDQRIESRQLWLDLIQMEHLRFATIGCAGAGREWNADSDIAPAIKESIILFLHDGRKLLPVFINEAALHKAQIDSGGELGL